MRSHTRPGFICRSVTLLSLEKRDEKSLGLDKFGEPRAENDAPPDVDMPDAGVLEVPDTDGQKMMRH